MADAAGKKKKTKAVAAKPAAAAAKAVAAKPKKKSALQKHKVLLAKIEKREKINRKITERIRVVQKENNEKEKGRGTELTADEKKALRATVIEENTKPRVNKARAAWAAKREATKDERAAALEKKLHPGKHAGYPSKQKKLKMRIAKRKARLAKITPEERKANRKPVHKDSLKKCGRLYCYSIFTGYKRGLRNQHENTALLKVQGCKNAQDARWYVGKKAAFVYKAKRATCVPNKPIKKKIRVIWGKVTRPHGHTGKVRAKFDINLPSTAMGKKIRIMLYPSNV